MVYLEWYLERWERRAATSQDEQSEGELTDELLEEMLREGKGALPFVPGGEKSEPPVPECTKLIEEVQSEDFRKGLARHLEQTRGHVTNVKKVFDLLEEEPEAEKCLGFEGLKKEHDELLSEVEDSLIDLDAGAAARTEHYEIAAYSGLIEMARGLGEPEAVGLLEENLKEEKEALHEVESVAESLRDELKSGAS